MRDAGDFERALKAISNGSSIPRCGHPKSTLLSRAEPEPAFEHRLAAAQQNGRLRLVSKPHVPGARMDREELIGITTDQARQGRGWACRTMLELLETERGGSRISDRFLKAPDGVDLRREGVATQPKRRTNPHGRTSTRS